MADVAKPACWKCGSRDVSIVFLGREPTSHKKGDCDASCAGKESCGTTPTGRMTCSGCGNIWTDGNIEEFASPS